MIPNILILVLGVFLNFLLFTLSTELFLLYLKFPLSFVRGLVCYPCDFLYLDEYSREVTAEIFGFSTLLCSHCY